MSFHIDDDNRLIFTYEDEKYFVYCKDDEFLKKYEDKIETFHKFNIIASKYSDFATDMIAKRVFNLPEPLEKDAGKLGLQYCQTLGIWYTCDNFLKRMEELFNSAMIIRSYNSPNREQHYHIIKNNLESLKR